MVYVQGINLSISQYTHTPAAYTPHETMISVRKVNERSKINLENIEWNISS